MRGSPIPVASQLLQCNRPGRDATPPGAERQIHVRGPGASRSGPCTHADVGACRMHAYRDCSPRAQGTAAPRTGARACAACAGPVHCLGNALQALAVQDLQLRAAQAGCPALALLAKQLLHNGCCRCQRRGPLLFWASRCTRHPTTRGAGRGRSGLRKQRLWKPVSATSSSPWPSSMCVVGRPASTASPSPAQQDAFAFAHHVRPRETGWCVDSFFALEAHIHACMYGDCCRGCAHDHHHAWHASQCGVCMRFGLHWIHSQLDGLAQDGRHSRLLLQGRGHVVSVSSALVLAVRVGFRGKLRR